MKIYNKLVIDLTSGEVLEEDSFEHAGPVAEAKGKGGDQQTQTQTNDPWSGQQPYLKQIFNEAARLYGGDQYANGLQRQSSFASMFGGGAGGGGGGGLGGGAFGKAMQQATGQFGQKVGAAADAVNPTAGSGAAPSSVIPFSAETEQALQQQAQMAQNSPTAGLLDATLRGDYLYGGAGFNRAYDAAANRIMPQINSSFARAGRSGSGLAQTAMAGALGDAFAGQYGQERNNQMQAMAMAPQVRYADVDRLAAVGEQREGLQREYAMEPWDRLNRYNSMIQGNYGGTSTSTQPVYRNKAAGALGGAAAGSYFGPWGALGGGLLGYFA